MSQWYLVKLELGSTEEFPRGSPGRAFLLRLPLARDGVIEAPAVKAAPREAYVRRFWQNERDRSGSIIRNGTGWQLAFTDGADPCSYHLADGAIQPGKVLELTDGEGAKFPFRVVTIRTG